MEDIVSEKVLASREYYKQYRLRNKEKLNEYFRRYYSENSDVLIARTNDWRKNNKESVASARKKRRDANPEKYRAQRKEYYARNREQSIERSRKYQFNHPEETKARKKAWYENNQEKYRTYSHNRRARVRNVIGGHFTDAEFQVMCAEYGNICLRCGEHKTLTADHVIPLGPPHSDEIENIQPLCLSCNSIKGAKTVDYR